MFVQPEEVSALGRLVATAINPKPTNKLGEIGSEIIRIGKCLEEGCSESEMRIHLQRIHKIAVEALNKGNYSTLNSLGSQIGNYLFSIVETGRYTPETVILGLQALFVSIQEDNELRMVNSLRRLLKSPAPSIREKAADLLEPMFTRIQPDGSVERALAERLKNDQCPDVKQACARSLSSWARKPKKDKKVSPGITALLAAATDCTDKETQIVAQHSLDFLGVPYPTVSVGISS